MIVYDSPKQCQKCQIEKRTFVGEVCFVCYWDERGEHFNWIKCSQCGVEWSKLKTDTLCYDCHEKSIDDVEKKKQICRTILRIFKSDTNFKKLSLDNLTVFEGMEMAVKAANEFLPEKNNLYFWGAPGRGKTHLAYGIVGKWVVQGKSADFLTVRGLVNRFRLLKPEEETARIDEMVGLDILVIDDFGKVTNSDFALDILTDILDKRALGGKGGLIITSNLFLDDFARKNNDDRLSSRISGMCHIVEVRSDYDFRLESRPDLVK